MTKWQYGRNVADYTSKLLIINRCRNVYAILFIYCIIYLSFRDRVEVQHLMALTASYLRISNISELTHFVFSHCYLQS